MDTSSRMRVTRLAVRTLLALFVAAAVATTARADEVEINGTPLSALGGSEEFVAELGTLEILTAGGIAATCEHGEAEGVLEAGAIGKATVSYSGNCRILGNKFCEVNEPIVAQGEGEVLLHAGNAYITSVAGFGNFTVVVLSGALCTLPEEIALSGGTVLKFTNPTELEEEKSLVTVSLEEQKLLGVPLLTAGNETAHLTPGSEVVAALIGEHAFEPGALTN